MPIILRPAGDADLSRAALYDDTALPQTIHGLAPGMWDVGRVVWAASPAMVTEEDDTPGTGFQAPQNLYSPEQSAFDTGAHVNGRGNWEVQSGKLVCTGNSPGGDARLSFDAPLTAGHAHMIVSDYSPVTGNVKLQFGGDGGTSGRSLTDDWTDFHYEPAAAVTGAFTRVSVKPNTSFQGNVDNIKVYDLSTVDPNTVVCDVILVGGDSNSTCATSELVTPQNRETPYDPRLWYVPSLRQGGSYDQTQSIRGVPQPMIEPVIGAYGARRMSPCHAVASRLADWSAARGRPLLVLAVGEAGTGLSGTEDWLKGSTHTLGNGHQTGSRMYDDMIGVVAALNALPPAHEIVGCVWSLGANDRFGGDYTVSGQWMDKMTDFVSNVRADVADVPMVLWSVGTHLGVGVDDGRSQRLRTEQLKLDQDSGDATWAIDRFKVVTPPSGFELGDNTDPHYTAAGMQAKGRLAGDALLSLLTTV